ncbi:hypothetical protein V5O48_010978 [Marasmius crinis-equi]|uniref:Uncharacterized protein n=1 Tax=Marasmius crinis-equi TaxID=585013 RepID=A0ABR3F6V9_9AGAR
MHMPDYLPRSPSHIESLLAIPEGQLTLAFSGMHSILDIADSQVRILHASFTDFLGDKSRSGDFYVDGSYYKSFVASCVLRYVNESLPDLLSDPTPICDPSSSPLMSAVWDRWYESYQNITAPTQELVSAFEELDVDKMYSVLVHGAISKRIYYWPQKYLLLFRRIREVVVWLEELPAEHRHDRLIARFRACSEGFHITFSEGLDVLDAALGGLCVGIGSGPFLPLSDVRLKTGHLEDTLEHYGDSRYRRSRRNVTETHQNQKCTSHPLSLAFIECSPGVFYVRAGYLFMPTIMEHVSLLTHPRESRDRAIEELLGVCEIGRIGLLMLAGQIPALLFLVLPRLRGFLQYYGDLMTLEEIMEKLTEWLKV